ERLRARGIDPFANTRAGASAHNRERAVARDIRGDLRRLLYYVVDHDAKTIVGPVGRRAVDAYEKLGLARPPTFATTNKAWLPVLLGWPEQRSLQALILHVLAYAKDGLSSSSLRAGVINWAGRLGQPIMNLLPGTLASSMVQLRRDGLIASIRSGRHEA